MVKLSRLYNRFGFGCFLRLLCPLFYFHKGFVMFDLIKSIIGYSGSNISNIDSYVLYASITVIVLLTVIGVDLIHKLFLSIFGRR